MAITTADLSPEESIKEQLGTYIMESQTHFAQSSQQGVERLVPHLTNKRVVDLGCGDGASTKFFTEHGVKVIGVDINQEKLDLNQTATICDDMVSYLKKQPDNSIPNIFCHHALEHLPNPQEVLDLISKKLPTGGVIYIEVPDEGAPHEVHHASFGSAEDLLPEGFEVVEQNTENGEHYLIARKNG